MLRSRRHPTAISSVVIGVLLITSCSTSSASPASPLRSEPTTATAATRDTSPGTTSSSKASNTPTSSTPTPDSFDPSSADGPTPDTSKIFGWTAITGADKNVQSGHLDVPIDPAHPEVGNFTLALVRHLAEKQDQRVGSLLVNPGGPGYGGTDLAEFATQVYGQAVLDHFDIVAWDPRGTGKSVPAVDCIDQYDQFFALDSSPDAPADKQALLDEATTFGKDCVAKNSKILPFVSTADTAADMDAIRTGLGENKISYFGFSYGSEIGVTWASLFPKTVRAMVIDGAADTTVGYLQQNLEQAAGFESTFNTLLTTCAKNTACPFYNGGDPGKAFDVLNAAADANPVATVKGRPNVTQGVLTTAISDAMYDQSYWGQLETALADLQKGDGKGVLALYDHYYNRSSKGTYGNELEAYFAINCLDDPGTKDPNVIFAMRAQFEKVAPRLGASWISELEFCAEWPVPAAPPVAVDAKGAGPVVVVGTTGDPATPLTGTRNTSRALQDGHLIVVTADQHTGYGVNDCVDAAVDNYLVDLIVPPDELRCNGPKTDSTGT